MSRRVSPIQRTVVTRKMISPTATRYQVSESDTMASASPAALNSGRMLGAGMWISSPTGGAAPLMSLWSLIGCSTGRPRRSARTSAARSWRRSRRCGGCGGRGGGPCQGLLRSGDRGGAEGLLPLQLRVQDHGGEQHRQIGEREQVRAQRAAAVGPALQAQREHDERRALTGGDDAVDEAEEAEHDGQQREERQQQRVE